MRPRRFLRRADDGVEFVGGGGDKGVLNLVRTDGGDLGPGRLNRLNDDVEFLIDLEVGDRYITVHAAEDLGQDFRHFGVGQWLVGLAVGLVEPRR